MIVRNCWNNVVLSLALRHNLKNTASFASVEGFQTTGPHRKGLEQRVPQNRADSSKARSTEDFPGLLHNPAPENFTARLMLWQRSATESFSRWPLESFAGSVSPFILRGWEGGTPKTAKQDHECHGYVFTGFARSKSFHVAVPAGAVYKTVPVSYEILIWHRSYSRI